MPHKEIEESELSMLIIVPCSKITSSPDILSIQEDLVYLVFLSCPVENPNFHLVLVSYMRQQKYNTRKSSQITRNRACI